MLKHMGIKTQGDKKRKMTRGQRTTARKSKCDKRDVADNKQAVCIGRVKAVLNTSLAEEKPRPQAQLTTATKTRL